VWRVNAALETRTPMAIAVEVEVATSMAVAVAVANAHLHSNIGWLFCSVAGSATAFYRPPHRNIFY